MTSAIPVQRSRHALDTIPFLDTSVSRDSNGLLTTTVYGKPTHTDQYLAYDSHHPQSVKRGIVISVYTTEPNTSHQNHQLSLKKRNIYHRYLFRTDILLHLQESSQRQQDQQPTKNLRRNLNLLRFYLHKRCIRGSSPLPTTTRRTHRLQVRHNS